MKTAMEMAFRDLMVRERTKKESKWPEGDIRRDITVVLWDRKEERKEQFMSRAGEQNGPR